MNLIDIVRSWFKALSNSPGERLLAKERMKVCNRCPHKTKANVCGECGCPLVAKQYSFFPCERWER